MGPTIRGKLAEHAGAVAFAAEVWRVHRRYAEEIVGRHRLCPFMKEPETAFGDFVVVLDDAPDLALAREVALAARGTVVHLVYPLIEIEPRTFERFGAEVGAALRESLPHPAPVIASFHPRFSGDASSPGRLVGLLRRAPDPFVQIVPSGLHEGGTVLAGALDEAIAAASRDPAELNFDRVRLPGVLADIEAAIADVQADRARSYAPHLAALR